MKLNIQLFIGAVAVIMLSALLSLTIDTYSTVKLAVSGVDEVKENLGKLENRVSMLEARTIGTHTHPAPPLLYDPRGEK